MAAFCVDVCEQRQVNEAILPGHVGSKAQDNGEHAGQSIVSEASRVIDDAFAKTVVDYWNKRSATYSNCILDEIDAVEYAAWKSVLTDCLEGIEQPCPHVLDLGCGPGFFEILLSQMGCTVVGVDSSAAMIHRASANIAAYGKAQNVVFHEGDVSLLPFEDNQFDLVVSRNVTWLMREPEKSYAEWRRVLKPGGKLLVFDANWYRYLADETTNEQRKAQQQLAGGACYEEDARATQTQETQCENIALQLPLTYELRPAWDEKALARAGYAQVSVDESVWERVWTQEEQRFYQSSPLFMIEATK